MASPETYDLIVVGGGPAGLAAATGAGSAQLRLSTLIMEGKGQLGGQAGTAPFIENCLGFPGGISGSDLTEKMVDQALSFGTEFVGPVRADGIERIDEGLVVCSDSDRFVGRTVLLSCGVEHRRLKAANLAAYMGRGIAYGSPPLTDVYDNKQLFVVGGANSAGKVALHLSQFTDCEVHILVRGEGIEGTMSSYLVDRVTGASNIKVRAETEVLAVNGSGKLSEVAVRSGGKEEVLPADEMFIMVGTAPRTQWLPEEVIRDDSGFVITGSDLPADIAASFKEACDRPPLPHETSMHGVFAAGDVRRGTVKRLTPAAGDAMTVIPELRQYLNHRRSRQTA